MIYLLGAGWRSLSTVDVKGAVTFTLWLCGCNLRCPFCHNHLLASSDPSKCFPLNVNNLVDDLISSRGLIDYFHVTGGEPLVQWRPLMDLLREVRSLGVSISLNTNLTLPDRLSSLLNGVEVDHLATDLKIPPEELYGLSPDEAALRWWRFIEGLRIASRKIRKLEIRVPVARSLRMDIFRRYAEEALASIEGSDYEIMVYPIVGPPLADPRDGEWCERRCNPRKDLLARVVEELSALSGRPVIMRDWLDS